MEGLLGLRALRRRHASRPAPIAFCEVQGYVYAAYLARAHCAFGGRRPRPCSSLPGAADELKRRFNQDFWVGGRRQWFAIGLDADKRRIDGLGSNMGHCLWTGIVDEEKAQARRPRAPVARADVQRLGHAHARTKMGGYNPVWYHCGGVWPHDNAIAAAGLMRYGFVDEAHGVVTLARSTRAVLQGGRLPELFSGLDRSALSFPVGYPTSCSPQAWAAASPLLFLRTLLRFEPWVPYGKTWLAPMVPKEFGRLRVEGIPLAGSRVDVEVCDGEVEIDGLPADIELIRTPRHPATAV